MKNKITAAVLALIFAFSAHAFGAEKSKSINSVSAMYQAENILIGECSDNTEKGTKQTVFIFMIGSDMTEYAENDIYEMLGSGYNDRDTNVILIAGGAENWNALSLNERSVGIYRLTESGFASLNDNDEYNIFDTDDIYKLMFRYMSRYRAERYSVFFWDHGGGFVGGFGKDESGENESISAVKLAKVFSDIKQDVKRDYGLEYNYDIVGFDACYMADIQTAQQFAEAGFRYYIASEDSESYYGWSYSFLGSGALTLGGEDLCRAVIDETTDFNRKHGVNHFTLSCLDLSRTNSVITELESLAKKTDANEKYLSARYKTRTFGNSDTDSRFDSGFHDYADIKDYAEKINDIGIDTAALTNAADSAVIYNSSTDEACGISVYSYYGSSKSSLSRWSAMTGEELESYKRLQRNTEKMINNHTETAAGESDGGAAQNNGTSYTYTMSAREAADTCDAVFCVYKYEDGIFKNVATVRDTSISGNTITAEYDSSLVYIVNGGERYPCAVEISGGKRFVSVARDSGKNAYAADFKNYKVELDANGGMRDIRNDYEEQLSAKENASIENGDRIYADISEYTEDNYPVHSVPDVFSAHNPYFELTALSGEYYGRFELINPYGYVQYRTGAAMIRGGESEQDNTSDKKAVEIKSSAITVGDTEISVPCSVDVLKAMGYEFVGEIKTLGSKETCLMSMKNGNEFIDITIKNFSSCTKTADLCEVTGISAADGTYGGLKIGDALDISAADGVYETMSKIKYIYKLNDNAVLPTDGGGELALNGLYNTDAHDYVVVETDKESGVITGFTVNSENGCEVSADNPKSFFPIYTAPMSLGYDPYSFVISIEGDLYSLPMPASALINNGWSLEGSTEVASMNSAETRFTRDGKQFTAELVNYGEYPTTMEDCVVCGIYFDFSGGAAADAVLSGGISLKNASASVMAGNLTDISNKASKFMSYGGGMLYAFGNPTDYDGQIEIMANGAYLYRRYNGIRSMSGFDRIAKYFVY